MSLFYFNVPYYVTPFPSHYKIQSLLLSKIEKSDFDINDGLKTDWFIKNKSQLYKDLVIPDMKKVIEDLMPNRNFKMLCCWFQQYTKYSYHSWHDHKCHWAMVYYITLPQGSKPTQFLVNEKVLDIDANEGDIAIFPGWIKHRSPANKSTEVKTVISINVEELV